jgi:hypothetical protein
LAPEEAKCYAQFFFFPFCLPYELTNGSAEAVMVTAVLSAALEMLMALIPGEKDINNLYGGRD